MRSAGQPAAKLSRGLVPRRGFSGRPVLWALLGVLLFAIPCGTSSQQPPGSASRYPGPSPRGFPQDIDQAGPNYDPLGSLQSEKRARLMNLERQKAMVAAADKLVKLAAELNREVARSDSTGLTLEQLRKVEEIEKLAHNVRDKMLMSIRSPQPGNMNNIDIPPPFFPSTTSH